MKQPSDEKSSSIPVAKKDSMLSKYQPDANEEPNDDRLVTPNILKSETAVKEPSSPPKYEQPEMYT